MGQMKAVRRADFSERLQRIERGGENTMGQIYVGPPSDEELVSRKVKTKKHKVKKPRSRGGLFAGLILGVLAFAGARLGLFHLVSEDGVYPAATFGDEAAGYLTAYGDMAAAGVLALVLLMLFRVRGGLAKLAAIAGIGLAIYGEQPAALQAPELYAAMTSDSYAAQQLAAPAAMPADAGL